jgi:ATP-dependent DNA helicase RecG
MQSREELISLIDILRLENSSETEWLEFKSNYLSNQDIGEYISALSNWAALKGRPFGYLVFGIDDKTHEVVGTTFNIHKQKQGNEDLENWLSRLLNPNIPFTVYDVDYATLHHVVLFEIPAAYIHPTAFAGKDYIRIGSYRQDLHKYPGTAKKLWDALNQTSYEQATSINQSLHFTEMLMIAKKRGVEFSEERFNTLRMLDANGRFNNLALLLSDENPHVVKFAVYKDDSLNFSVKEEFTGCWLLMLDQVFKYVNLYNTTSATIGKDLARTESKRNFVS